MESTRIERRGLRAKEAAQYIGMGRSTFLRWVKEGKAPAPRKLAPKVVVWLKGDLDRWMESAGDEA